MVTGHRASAAEARRLALIVASTSIASLPLFVESAQAQRPVVSSSNLPQQKITFAISTQSLSGGIVAFSRAADVDLVFDGAIPLRSVTKGVSGTFTVSAGLNRLLEGTGLSARLSGARTVQIFDPRRSAATEAAPAGSIALDTITVQGENPNSVMGNLPAAYAGGQVATGGQVGLLGNRSVMDTPFNQTNYTAQTINDQQARTVDDVLYNDPSFVVSTPSSHGFTAFSSRGFELEFGGTNVSFNGLYGIMPAFAVSAGMAERVAVLKGPSALLKGMPGQGAGLGGSIELTPKRATDDPLARLTTGYSSHAQYANQVDLGRRFGPDKEIGVRFNGSYRNGEGAVEGNKLELGHAHLAVDYRGERARLSADIGYQKQDADGVTRFASLANGVPVPRAPDASRNFTPDWQYYYNKDAFVALQGEVDITENVTAFAAVGQRRSDGESYLVLTPTIQNTLGDWRGTADRGTSRVDALSWQGGIRASAVTGLVGHALSVSISKTSQEGASADVYSSALNSNIYNPLRIADPLLRDPGLPRKTNALERTSVGVADTLSILDNRIQLTVGVRHQQVDAENFNASTGARTSGYGAAAWSPAYALVVKPWTNVSLYANYIEGLEQGTVVGTSYANAGEVFPPYQTQQYEAGVKIDWSRFTTTLSAFQMARPSVISIPGVPAPTLALNGEQVNQGVELNVFGEVTPDVRLLGGVMFLNARLRHTANGAYDGNKAGGAPDANFVIGGEWDTPFISGLTLTGRANYSGETYYDQANIRTVPSWKRLDLGARYTFNSPWNEKPVTIRFNVENVFDSNYWLSRTATNISLAAPRTYNLSTTFHF